MKTYCHSPKHLPEWFWAFSARELSQGDHLLMGRAGRRVKVPPTARILIVGIPRRALLFSIPPPNVMGAPRSRTSAALENSL